MSTPEFEVHRAIVHYSDPITGEAQVRIPSLLGAGQVVSIPTIGLTLVGDLWNVPPAGTSVFVAVSHCRTHYLWLAAVGASPSSAAVTTYTVNGGTTGTQPTFSGGPLFTGHYIRVSDLVTFDVQVDMDNITSFGTGQYFVSLPFPCHEAVMVRNGCLHDSDTGLQYHISGHADKGSSTLYLYTTDIQGQRLTDFEFEQGEPITLTTADNFHIQGSYIAEPT